MKKKLHLLMRDRFVSRLLIFGIDLILVLLSFLFVHFLLVWRMKTNMPISSLLVLISVVMAAYGGMFYLLKPYRGVVRQSTFRDITMVFISTICACLFLGVVNFISKGAMSHYMWTNTHLFMHATLTFLVLFMWRLAIKLFFFYALDMRPKKNVSNVVIYGAGKFGQTTLEVLKRSYKPHYRIIGFLDDNLTLKNKSVQNVPVLGGIEQAERLNKLGVTEVVLAINSKNLSREMKQQISSAMMHYNLQVKIAPETETWIDGTFKPNQIKNIEIKDLLSRNSIKMDMDQIGEGISGKTVMVTGAAGSIGSEIVRQLTRFDVKRLVLIDQAESALYDVQQELKQLKSDLDLVCIVADVSNAFRMKAIFVENKPQVLFNAAAYKHVPLMEENPYEAIRVNIGGCRVLSELAVTHKVEKFVMVSTDKAVNPTNVMGASKRICEMYVQALAKRGDHQTSFITTRFGNVLGSNGSVVPLFKKQIAAGGPVTVTHKDITRYFMTIPEACQLVLEAGFMGKGGEIFLFDMGKPVKIYSMARKMIRLSGFEPDVDIQIKVTGLRDGEKLYEELLANEENTTPTYHDKIMIADVREVSYDYVSHEVKEMISQLELESNMALVARMKLLVPEFKSNHSQYCALDSNPIVTATQKVNDSESVIEA
ncbi:polysaccharide biosynthesis protein [Halosquirtibacter laminarini]|uniref:Polysaccharide biosynthesis protein n=1 Tax=Halosquirtibacter laminarini TaxID=3374600 RepID=A0AC61NN69_9BACT|nr:polysaccharide biosynthesis protein [Prolixibacteraceae bacterium]